MPGYLNQNGNSIGSLLRFIQEQKSQGPIVPPSTEVGSPIRDVVQEPLKAPESIGTSRQVSIKPEDVLGGESQQALPIPEVGAESLGPIAPVASAATPGQITPAAASTSSDAPMTPTVRGETRSAVYSPSPAQPSSGQVKGVSIGAPVIKAATPQITPQRNITGGTPILGGSGGVVPTPTPAPTNRGSISSGQATVYPQTGSTSAVPTLGPTPTQSFNKLAQKPTQTFTPPSPYTGGGLPSIGTILNAAGGGALQGFKKLFGWK